MLVMIHLEVRGCKNKQIMHSLDIITAPPKSDLATTHPSPLFRPVHQPKDHWPDHPLPPIWELLANEQAVHTLLDAF